MDEFPHPSNEDPRATSSQEGSSFPTSEQAAVHGASVPDETAQARLPLQSCEKPHAFRSGVAIFISWMVILLLVGFIMSAPFLFPRQEDPAGHVDLTAIELQSKVIVGMSTLPISSTDRKDLYNQCKALDIGPFENRLCFAILVGEIAGAKKAKAALETTLERVEKTGYELSDIQSHLASTLATIFNDRIEGNEDAIDISQKQRDELFDKLGWFGTLAIAPPEGTDPSMRSQAIGPAQRAAISMITFFGVGLLMLLAGIAGLVGVVIMVSIGWIRSGMGDTSGSSAIYVETFAIWMVLFFGLSILFTYAAKAFHFDNELILSGCVALGSLLAITWPIVRGIRWNEFRVGIGWTLKNPFVEVVYGVICYVLCLPLLGVGVLCLFVLSSIFLTPADANDFSALETPSHPIVQRINDNGVWGIMQIYLLACVIAPLVEETTFRGLLYRHLRMMSRRWNLLASVVMSAMVNGFLFAAIHPQGLLAIPALMSLAFGFSLAREWRGSLVAPVTMHAMNNTLVTTFLVTVIAS